MLSSTKDAPVRSKPVSYEEYLTLAPDSGIMEWVNGEVISYVPPTFGHQELVSFLHDLLSFFVRFWELGKIIPAPFEVKLWTDGPAREPDLIFVGTDSLDSLGSNRFAGGPDLLIEIVSPSSVSEDKVRKYAEYEQAGVREYWVIDPRPFQEQADFYVLDNQGVYQPGVVDDSGRFYSTALPHFWLNVTWLRPSQLPDPQLVLAEIMLTIPDLPDSVRQAYQALYEMLASREQE